MKEREMRDTAQRWRHNAAAICVLVLLACSVEAGTVKKAPYLIFTGDSTGMDLLWQLTELHIDTVSWGTDQSHASGKELSAEYGADHQHRFRFTGLAPATRYYYKVNAGDTVYTGSFRSAPPGSSTSLKFIAYGDTRTYPDKHNLVAAAVRRTIDADSAYQTLVVSVGDLVADGSLESNWTGQFFDPQYANIRELLGSMAYQSCRGNHEKNAVLFRKYFPYPAVSATYWAFTYGPALFVMLDQYVAYDSLSDQFRWADLVLGASAQPWKFIVLHEPGWSAGGHGNSANVQKYIQPLCEKYDVPIVFGGHNHYYARAEVPAAGGRFIQHVTVGGGGAPLYGPDTTQPYIVAAAKEFSFSRIAILNDRQLEFEALTAGDSLIDRFTIDRPALPIELVTFNAAAVGAHEVKLEWETLTEGNTLGFYVERRLAGATGYTRVSGLIPGAGTSMERHRYAWVDSTASTGTIYYRLCQVDLDGSVHYLPEITVAVTGVLGVGHEGEYRFTLRQNYPNPFNPSTTFSFELPFDAAVRLALFDAGGRRVATIADRVETRGAKEVRWDASALASGTYFCRLEAVKLNDPSRTFTEAIRVQLVK